MLSGNGRHRRPRQAPAIFVTAGVTSAGIAMPLLGATGAQAADLDTWDRVAQCESGGLWSADTGNGYYGGLQLTQETWEQYGGTAYAERPDLASRGQQIAIAEKILADQGPDAWPSCGVNAGLRHDTTGETPAIDPGLLLPLVEEEPDSPAEEREKEGGKGAARDSDGSAADADTGGRTGTDAGADAETGTGAAPKPDADADADADAATATDTDAADTAEDGRAEDASGAGTGRHRGERDPREAELEQRTEGRPSDGQEAAQDERPEDAADRTDRSARAGAVSGPGIRIGNEDYLVRPGDSLVSIAEEYAVRGGWNGLYESNKNVVGEDPDLILPGQELDLG